MSANQKRNTSDRSEVTSARKVVHLYQVRPEMALEHLKRSTGLDFDSMPQSLVNRDSQVSNTGATEPPLLTDVVKTRA